MKKKIIDLCGNDWIMKDFIGLDWVWRNSVKLETRDTRWWQRATVPGSIVNDLFLNNQIPDPLFERNSLLIEWVPERSWVLKKEFTVEEILQDSKSILVFDGIDYEGQIFLNDVKIGEHSGMFTQCKIDITKNIKIGKNLIAVALSPAPKEQPQIGKTSLTQTLKGRMTYWWDFCPRMIHLGIWDKVRIEISDGNVFEDAFIHSKLDSAKNEAKITIDVVTQGLENHKFIAYINDTKYKSEILSNEFSLTFDIQNPKLWYPNGYGEQYQYKIVLQMQNDKGEITDQKEIYHGIKEISWEGQYGLIVNGKRIYIRGYNWVPIDALYGVERTLKLDHLLELAKNANVNLIRVWGGGLIEKDEFYKLCAQKGILIWQEFILSSSGIDNIPPHEPEFISSSILQVQEIIKRKRNFTALAIWCGGNELQDENGPICDDDLFISQLKETVKALDPQKRFLATSPLGGVFSFDKENLVNNKDKLIDVHGPWEHQGINGHYELYNMGYGVLHSEFGVEAMTNYDALEKTISKENMLPVGKDNKIYFHRGAWWNNQELVQNLFFHEKTCEDIQKIKRSSQYLQYEGLRYAIERNRSEFPKQCGTLPWQLNEPYPNAWCTSAIDYYGHPKPGYYGAKKAYEDCSVAARFDSASLKGKDSLLAKINLFTTSKIFGEDGNKNLLVEYSVTDIHGTIIGEGKFDVISKDEGVISVGDVNCNIANARGTLILLRLYVRNQSQEVIGENEYLFTTTDNYFDLHKSEKAIISVEKENDILIVKNNSNVTAYWINSEHVEGNYFNLLPGERRKCIEGVRNVKFDGFNIKMKREAITL